MMTSSSNRANSTRKAKRLISHSHSTPTHSSRHPRQSNTSSRIVWRDNIETSRDANNIRDDPPTAFSSLSSRERMEVNQIKPSRNTKRCSPYVILLLLLVVFQTVIIYKLMTGTSTKSQFSAMMELMMDSPKAIGRSSPMKTNSRDVIIYLAQFSEVHSSYGAQSDATHNNVTGLSKFKRSLDLLHTNYLHQHPCDVIIFYDSTSPPTTEIQSNLRINIPQIQFRELNGTYWELPYGLEAKFHHKWKRPKYSIGYRHMMRWFAILLWPYLENMGYTHVMRLDDDSYIHSKIEYNMFDHMRAHGRKYGFRQPVRDSAVGKGYDAVVNNYLAQHPNATTQERIDAYHNVSHRVGFYNNFFVADISFFTTEPVKGLLQVIDESNLIYTQRTGDLVIHSTVVRLFARPDQIQWFRDFTYEHMTLCRIDVCGAVKQRINYRGCPENGGISRGLEVYTDKEWEEFATKIKNQFNASCEVEIDKTFIGADDSVRDGEVMRHQSFWDFLGTLPTTNRTMMMQPHTSILDRNQRSASTQKQLNPWE